MSEGGAVVAICQFGGEFTSESDGSMTYAGGEAHAVDIDRSLKFDDFKLEITSLINIDLRNMSFKYFLPNNRRTLITVSCDKDLHRMIDFYQTYVTVDVYIMNKINKSTITDCRPSTVVNALTDNARRQKRPASKMVISRSGRKSQTVAPTIDPPTIHQTDVSAVGNSLQSKLGAPRASSTIPSESILPLACSIPAVDEFDQYLPISSNDIITGVGQEFDNVKDFRDKLCEYAICKGFTYRFVKNETARVTVKCTAENCPWRIHASQITRKKKIVIKKLVDIHTCGGGTVSSGQRRVTKKWLVNIIKKKLLESSECKPKEIADEVYQDYGVPVSYFQVWHAKTEAEKELYNMHIEACNQLPWFCSKLIELNPGSFVNLATSVDSRFRVFIAFHASLHGFQYGCRPFILLDTIPLQKNNQLRLLAAATFDGDEGVFPIAFAAVEAENHDSWFWFLEQLKSAIVTSCTLTFISNRGHGLDQVVPELFENSYHGYCIVDIVEDFRTELKKGSWSDEVEAAMVNDLESAALACTIEEFNAHIEGIRKVSEAAADWVLSTKPEHWSNALFKGARYNHFSADITEFGDWISVRQESSVVLILYIICSRVMEVINERRETSSTWDTTLTPSVEQKLKKEMTRAKKLEVLCSSKTVFEVRGTTVNVVNIENWDCTCRIWQLSGFPCIHAIAVLDHLGRSIYEYCSQFFTTECYRATYSESIVQIPGVEKISPTVRANLYPSPTRQNKGPRRIQDKRRKGDARELHCSKCKGVGHNKTTCEATM